MQVAVPIGKTLARCARKSVRWRSRIARLERHKRAIHVAGYYMSALGASRRSLFGLRVVCDSRAFRIYGNDQYSCLVAKLLLDEQRRFCFFKGAPRTCDGGGVLR